MISLFEKFYELRHCADSCTKCPLHETRKNVVFGSGSLTPLVAFIGEAPGATEDETGIPFAGVSGKKLNEWIEWMGLERHRHTYILNNVLCRPPSNRNPTNQELNACEDWMTKQLDLVKPKFIVTLGRVAACNWLEAPYSFESLGELRGKWYYHKGIPTRCTYHPAYIKRNPAAQSMVYDDLRAVREEIDKHLGSVGQLVNEGATG